MTTAPNKGMTKNLWLAADRTIGGAGTASDPFAANTKEKVLAIWNAHTEPGVTFHYLPGTYEVLCWGWNDAGRQTARPWQRHVGSGMFSTTLKMKDVMGWSANWNDGPLFAGAGRVDGFGVFDLTIDCDGDNQPTKTNPHGNGVSAINVQGSFIRVVNVRVKGFGTFRSGVECFPVLLCCGADPALYEDILIRGCRAELPAHDNADGVSAFVIGVNTTNGATGRFMRIEDSYVGDLSGVGFGYAHGFCAPTVQGCESDCETGIYIETTSPLMQHYRFQGNRIRVPKGGRGIDALIGNYEIRSVAIHGNDILFAHPNAMAGVSVRLGGTGLIHHVAIQDNHIGRVDPATILDGTKGIEVWSGIGKFVEEGNTFDMK